tara:strand:+ start:442 stop:654 length:213 start_codon:yes stop_codon:yes gene_type:complete
MHSSLIPKRSSDRNLTKINNTFGRGSIKTIQTEITKCINYNCTLIDTVINTQKKTEYFNVKFFSWALKNA